MKIYTKTGDDGMTGLIGGSRVAKSDPRIECYGTVDELNAMLGWATMIRQIQNELFVIGSHLAMPDESKAASPNIALPALDSSAIARMESQIDAADAQLAPLQQFILPGGTEAASRLHLARTVCRRAERLLVLLSDTRPSSVAMITYLNRLSDWLFVQARWVNQQANIADIPWVK
jgi:cob(I)alamin adenosyltransferase